MGLGDLLHWTAIVRDLYNDINNENFNERINKINKYIKNYEIFKKYGVYKYIKQNNIDNFKFVLVGLVFKKIEMYKNLFINNPYVISCQSDDSVDTTYPNIIYFKIVSSHYYVNKKFLDTIHVVSSYAINIGLKKYNINPDIHFTEKEICNVKKYLPKEKFIYIEPNNHKVGRSYPFDKFQYIVNKYHEIIKFIQISPSKFANTSSKILDNVTSYIDIFTYRETLYFISFAEFIIVNHGGLSIGAAATNTKTIAIYPAWFNPIMTKYENEIAITIATKEHSNCNSNFDKFCKHCSVLFNIHDVNIITKCIDNLLLSN